MQGKFTAELEKMYREWFKTFSNTELYEHTRRMERLICDDDVADSLIMDECIDILKLLNEECVRRVGQGRV